MLKGLFSEDTFNLERKFDAIVSQMNSGQDEIFEECLRTFISENGLMIEHFTFDQSCHSVAEAADVVGATPQDFVKNICLIAEDGRFLVAIIKGEDRVDLKKVASAIGSDAPPRLATPEEIYEFSGYPCGGTPPFGYNALFLMDERTFEKGELFTGGGSVRSLLKGSASEFRRANGAIIAHLRR